MYNFSFLVYSAYFRLLTFCLSLATCELVMAVLNLGKKNSIFCFNEGEKGKSLKSEDASFFNAVSKARILAASVLGNLL